MRGFALLVLVLAAIGHGTGVDGQRQGGANPAGRQGGAEAGRQGGVPPTGRQGGARPVRDRAESTGTAVIRGRVVTADSGAPMRRAEVQATTGGARPRVTLTDADGNFELRDLPAGTWMVRASKSGFVAQQFGQRSPFGPAEPITLADGQQVSAHFALSRAGAITGRVFDEFGDPIANVRVGALRVQWTPNGRRLAAAGATVMTDDTGAYRVYGLPPGRYYVSATFMTPAIANGALTSAEGPITYSAVYFPGTADLAQAQPVEVGLGQEQTSINVALTPVPAVRIAGVVIGANGTPAQATVTLAHPALDEVAGVGGRGIRTGNDGTFSVAGVSPGTYTLEVMSRPRNGSAPEVASLPLTVSAGDITGLTVTLTSGGKIEGTIATDNGTRLPFDAFRVAAPPLRPAQSGYLPRAQATASGSFELTGLIGPHNVRVEQVPTGWAVKSITANGTDITDLALDFRGNEHVSVRIVLTDRITVLTGTVRSDQPARGVSIVIFPDDPAKWTSLSRFLRTARAGEAGQFTLRGLPPHSRYLAAALDYVENGEHLDPDFLKRLRPLAASFSLGEGEQQTIEVPLVARQ